MAANERKRVEVRISVQRKMYVTQRARLFSLYPVAPLAEKETLMMTGCRLVEASGCLHFLT